MMNRRRFLHTVSVSLLAAPLVAEAQPSQGPSLVGFLPLGSPSDAYDQSLVAAFREGVRETGVVENRDVLLNVMWTGGELELSQAVLNLKQRGVKLLIPVGTTASMAVRRHAPTTPILFISVGNPLGIGLVSNLARPGGDITGFSDVLADLGGKYVQYATEIGKPQGPVHYLWYDGWTDGQHRLQVTEQAAQSLNVKFRARAISDLSELDNAMTATRRAGASVVIVQPSPFTYLHRDRVVESAARHGLATIFPFRPAAAAGAVITYGPDYEVLYRRAASYLARILRGTKPGDLPVEQPTKFELVINLKTARALGLTIPRSLLLQADQVIE